MNKVLPFIYILISFFTGNAILAQNSILDSLVLVQTNDSLFGRYKTDKTKLLDLNSVGGGAIEQREQMLEFLSARVFTDELLETLGQDSYLVDSLNSELLGAGLALYSLEGNYSGIKRINFPEKWETSCKCPAEIEYAHLLALKDANRGSEYPFANLEPYFLLVSTSEKFIDQYSTHRFAAAVTDMYKENISLLCDIHIVESTDTDVQYVQGGLSTDPWPGKFDIGSYRQLVEAYPFRYSALLKNRMLYISAVKSDVDTFYVVVIDEKCCKTFEGIDLHTVSLLTPKDNSYKVLGFHYDKAKLDFLKKKYKGQVLRVVKKTEGSVAIVK